MSTTAFGRRTMLRATGAAAVVAGLGGASATAVPARPGGRIDVHHHAAAKDVTDWLRRKGKLPEDPAQWPSWARWDLGTTLNVMRDNDIAAGVASSPAPFYIFADEAEAAEGATVINETLAALVAEHPTRFGFFAYLPLPHVDSALTAARYALDELGADGVNLMTHAGEHYLGDPAFDPVLEELNRRRCVVFTHPFDLPGGAAPGVPDHLGDFLLDTTRAAIRMILAGTLDRFPNLSIILSHAGGFLPYMAGRIDAEEGVDPGVVREALRRFHYDTALPASPYATPSLLRAVDHGRILFGTDWNANPASVVGDNTTAFDRDPELDRHTRRQIGRDNALRLLPRLAARLGG